MSLGANHGFATEVTGNLYVKGRVPKSKPAKAAQEPSSRRPGAPKSIRKPDLAWWEAQQERLGLKRVGGELHGPCPVCGGTDRFRVNERGVFCRQCAPTASAAGLRAILDAAGWSATNQAPPAPPKAERKPPRKQPAKPRTADYAMRVLAASQPIEDSKAAVYLLMRGLWAATEGDYPALRYHPEVHAAGASHPALVVPLAPDFGAKPTGCHVVLLTDRGEKADIEGGAKRNYGTLSGNAAWLGERKTDVVVIAEGIEDALSAALLESRKHPNAHPVATAGTAGLAKWTRPNWCKHVVIAMDRDVPGAKAAWELHYRLGDCAELRWPQEGKDANDELRRKAAWT